MTESQIMTFITSYALVILVVAVITLIAMWKIFEKAGEKGWKCLIPIYSLHVFARVCWRADYFWYVFLANVALSGIGTAVGGGFGTLLTCIGSLISLVYAVLSMHHLSRRFGRSTGFTVCLVLFNTICMCILGFGSDRYSLINDK